MQWLKLYSEWAADPKVQTMTEVMQRRHAMILCLRCLGPLEELTAGEIAHALHISLRELEKTRQLFVAKGFIAEDWSMPKWEARQRNPDSKAAERMRRHRANVARNAERNGDDPLRVTSHVTATPRARGRGEESREEEMKGARAPLNVHTNGPPEDPAPLGPEYEAVRRLAADLGGSDAWGAWVEVQARDGYPPARIAEVLRNLSGRGQLRMRLAEKILADGPDRRPGQPPPPPAPVARPVRIADAVREERMWAGVDPQALTAAEAKARSESCPYCDGLGWARLFRKGREDSSPVNAFCLCPLGEWNRAHTPEDVVGRVPDLAGVLAGKTVWTLDAPGGPT